MASPTYPDINPLSMIQRPREPLTINARTSALLMVDLQYFDAHRDWGEGLTAKTLGIQDRFEGYYRCIDEILPRARYLLDAFRASGAEVVHVRVAERTRDSRDVAPKQLLRGLIVPSNSKEAELLEEVAPIGDELIFSKSSSGMFPATDADRIFRNLGIDTLIMCGTSTGGCIESSAREAVDLGYRVIIVEDACAASTPADHVAALDRLRGPTCWTSDSTEVLAALRQSSPRSRSEAAGTERVKAFLPQPPKDPEQEADPYELIFPPPKPVELGRADSVLLLLDVTSLSVDPNGPLFGQAQDGEAADAGPYLTLAERAVGNISRLVDAALATGMRPIHVRIAGRTATGEDLAPAMRKLIGGIPADHPAAAPDIRLATSDRMLLLSKPGQSPFVGTGLDELLRHLGVTKLVLCGLSVLGAVETALRGATDRGYQVLLVPDACAAATRAGQKRLGRMGAGLIEVASLDEALARIAAAS